MRKYYKIWSAGVVACVFALAAASVLLHQSFGLTALSDVVQALLLFSATISLIPHAIRARGRLRLFWTLITLGIGLWFCYQLLWIYFEVLLRTDVPDLCAGDMVLFLHIVPLMAALALRPHAPQDEYAARLRHLDFALLMIWWGYLYILIVIPWQYVVPNIPPYNDNLNLLYLIEKIAFLTTLILIWAGSKGGWRKFYGNLFGACVTYATSSYLANWALGHNNYYSGCFYDIPLAASMAWITFIGLWTPDNEPQAGVRSTSTSHGVWLARMGMIAAFSLPLFGAWALLDSAVPLRIRSFRVALTLGAAIVMGVMVFIRQRLLDRELLRLLTYSHDSFENLKRLQTQITESEKLASIGQLVAGAAHELNNPITAMLGYSDLLALSKPLNGEQLDLAGKIGQHARRIKSLVGSLLSFARPVPASFAPVDLKTLLHTAVKLSQSQWQVEKVSLRTEFSEGVLLVRGDSNQLLQVCVQIIKDALRALDQRGSSELLISARAKDGFASVEICDAGVGPGESTPVNSAQILSSLGLNACQAILKQHHGQIFCESEQSSRITIRVELPLILPAARSNATAPDAWEPQPSA